MRSPLLVVAVGELRASTHALDRARGDRRAGGLRQRRRRGLALRPAARARRRRARVQRARRPVGRAGRRRQRAGDRSRSARPPPRAASARSPACAAVRAYRGGFLDIGDRRVWVVAPSRADPRPLLPSQLLDGDLDRRDTSACAATAGSASRARSRASAACTSATSSRCPRPGRCGCGSPRSSRTSAGAPAPC